MRFFTVSTDYGEVKFGLSTLAEYEAAGGRYVDEEHDVDWRDEPEQFIGGIVLVAWPEALKLNQGGANPATFFALVAGVDRGGVFDEGDLWYDGSVDRFLLRAPPAHAPEDLKAWLREDARVWHNAQAKGQ
jgi:hypothetical protein